MKQILRLLPVFMTILLVAGCSAPQNKPGRLIEVGKPNMHRTSSESVVLPTGEVLFTADADWGKTIPNPEIYMPHERRFYPTGQLKIQNRRRYRTTLLNDGRVIMVGGHVGSNIDNPAMEAEIYDPDTGTFHLAGSLNYPRTGLTATTLSNGKVFISGGSIGGRETYVLQTKTELYNPESGIFSIGPDLNKGRSDHKTVALTNGDALVFDGYRYELIHDKDGQFIEMRKEENIDLIELYHQATNKMIPVKTPVPIEPNYIVNCIPLPDGDALFIVSDRDRASFYLFRHVSKDLVEVPIAPKMRRVASALILKNGTILVSGSKMSSEANTSDELLTLDLSSNTISTIGQFQKYRWASRIILLSSGKLLITGGGGEYGVFHCYPIGRCPVKEVEIFDPELASSTIVESFKKDDMVPTGVFALNDGQALLRSTKHTFIYVPNELDNDDKKPRAEADQ